MSEQLSDDWLEKYRAAMQLESQAPVNGVQRLLIAIAWPWKFLVKSGAQHTEPVIGHH
jgi:hypothetical protein